MMRPDEWEFFACVVSGISISPRCRLVGYPQIGLARVNAHSLVDNFSKMYLQSSQNHFSNFDGQALILYGHALL